MPRLLAALALASIILGAEPGQPAPGLAAAAWVRGTAPSGTLPVVVGVWEGVDAVDAGLDFLHAAAAKHGDRLHTALLVVAAADEVRGALAALDDPGLPVAAISGEARSAWLGEAEAPMVAAVDGAGTLLWLGQPSEAEDVVASIAAGSFDPAVEAKTRVLHREVEKIMEAEAGDEGREAQFAKAERLLTEILAIAPLDLRALHLRLAIARERGDRPGHAAVLAAIPVDRLPGEAANQLAWDLAVEEDLAWRRLGPALRLAQRACIAAPDEPAFRDTLARVCYGLGLLDEAIAIQLKAVSLAPDDANLQGALEFYREVKAEQSSYLAAPSQAEAVPALAPISAPAVAPSHAPVP